MTMPDLEYAKEVLATAAKRLSEFEHCRFILITTIDDSIDEDMDHTMIGFLTNLEDKPARKILAYVYKTVDYDGGEVIG